ncbi:blastula protease 10-like, partial [Lingula anatina]|uniref:Blastula protease 10-like n=1 Tax=Lingula anatina TaxID=7574 RepID=A0A1S3J5N5_LINAN
MGAAEPSSPSQREPLLLQGAKGIDITVLDFELEIHDVCRYDFVNIRGVKYCNNVKANTTMSFPGNTLVITFHSDRSVVKKGFKIKYKASFPVLTTLSSTEFMTTLIPTLSTAVRPERDICGQTIFNNATGMIRSPRHPLNYPTNIRCVYSIRTPGAIRYHLHFGEFSLESAWKCNGDYVKITSGVRSLGRICGTEAANKTYTYDTDSIELEFVSDGNVQRSGFSLRYNAEIDMTTVESGIEATTQYYINGSGLTAAEV